MKKRILSIVLTLCMVLMLLPTTVFADTTADGNFEYSVSDNEVTITKYTGSAAEIAIPDTIDSKPVTAIGERAFQNCSSLTSVTIPGSVTSIGEYAFCMCSSLTSINIPAGVTSIEVATFFGCSSLTGVTIPSGVTSIGTSAFAGCSSLTSITIPNSVTIIGSSAFIGCTSLESIDISDSVTSINYKAFYGCKSLKSIDIPYGVTSIGEKAFSGCTSLESVTIPNSVISIGLCAFENCASLTSIDIPDSVTLIYAGVFRDCTSLTSVTIPNSVTSIADESFANCTSLESVTIPNSVKSIGQRVFQNCTSLKSVDIPDSVTLIYAGVFRDCTSLTSVTIPNRVTIIGNFAFQNCTSLTSVDIPNSVTIIGNYAFQNCTSLESIFLPEGLDVTGASIPNTTSQVKYSLDTEKGEVTITEIALGTGKTGVAIPATICGYPVAAVEASQQSKVGGHTCKGGTATCTAKAVCSLCGKEYGELPAHAYEWKSENGQYWQKCQVCQYETAKKAIPEITIDAPDKVCRTQDCEASVSLPGSLSFAKLSYEFLGLGGDLDMTFEDGKLNGVVKADSYPNVENSFNLVVYAATDDGFPFNVSKTVEIQNEHAGGTATCTAKAICDTCGEKYGELDSANHDLEKIPAKDATVTATGNKEYWHCTDCGKYFADEKGKTEIKLADTVIAKLPPEIIEGKRQSVTEGEQKELTFRSNAAFSDFICAQLDGKTLDEKNYTVKEGSTVVTLKADYVATLSAGEHTIGIVSESGTATTTFTVNAKAVVDNDTKSPQTGDNSHMALWIALLFMSGAGVIGTMVYGKKRRAK